MRTESIPVIGRDRRMETTARTRKVAAVHLLLVGAVQAGTGLALVYGAATGRLLRLLIANLGYVFDGVGAVQHGSLLTLVATRVAPAVGVAMFLAGVAALFGGHRALSGERYRTGVAAGAVGLLNPLVAPLAFIALTLLYLSRAQFADSGTERRP